MATNNLSELCERAFTPFLRQSVLLWSEHESEGGVLRMHSSASVLRKRLEIIASEASYLGYSRLLQLCKAAKASVEVRHSQGWDRSDNDSGQERDIAWDRAWRLIVASVKEPNSLTATETRIAVRSLQQAFQLNDLQIKEEITIRNISTGNGVDGGALGMENTLPKAQAVEDPNHQDTNVYRKDVIGAFDHCSQEESWIVSQLANLAEDIATGVSAHRPAHRLMSVLRGHRFFQYVDRVCLAGRVPGTNQLVIVDSAVSERSVRNELLKGYSCFVNPKGSLFSMQPSTVRVFAECNQVLESFHHQNKPAQRSIALIAEQGLRSGLCMAIGRGDTIQGFLFLNSMEPSHFADVTSRYAPLLSLFGLVGTISLDAAGFLGVAEVNPWPVADSIPSHSIHFEASQLEAWLIGHLKHWTGKEVRVEMQVQEGLDDFLYLPRVVVQAISDSLMQMSWNHRLFDKPLRIVIERILGDVSLAIAHGSDLSAGPNNDRISALVASMNDKFLNCPIGFQCDSDYVKFRFPFEPTIVGAGGQLYSIVH